MGEGERVGIEVWRGLQDDGKRFVEVPSGTSCAERFMSRERDDIEKTRERVRGGEGHRGRLDFGVGG